MDVPPKLKPPKPLFAGADVVLVVVVVVVVLGAEVALVPNEKPPVVELPNNGAAAVVAGVAEDVVALDVVPKPVVPTSQSFLNIQLPRECPVTRHTSTKSTKSSS